MVKRAKYKVMEGDEVWGSGHAIEYTDVVLESRTAEIYVMLSTNATPINLIFKNSVSNWRRPQHVLCQSCKGGGQRGSQFL